MAVTEIWRVKVPVKDLINYARDPEKTEDPYPKGERTGEQGPETRCFVTGIHCREEAAAEQFMETKRFWSRASGRDKTGGTTCIHGIQSFAEGEVDPGTAHEIGVELARRLWADRYEVLVATHCNTDHYHSHFIINATSWRDGRKWRPYVKDLMEMKEMSDRLCLKHHLSVIEDGGKGRKKNYREHFAEKNGQPTIRGLIRQDIDRAVAASLTEGEFFRNLEEMGYELRIRDGDGRPAERPALRPPGAEHFYVFRRLGGDYCPERIRERLMQNRRRELPFPEEEREAMRAYRAETQPRPGTDGILALYLRYCYELGILQRFPGSVNRISAEVRRDIVFMDRLRRQTVLMESNGIRTAEDLSAYREKISAEYRDLEARRKEKRRESEQASVRRDPERMREVREERSELTARMKTLREEIRLCGAIAERSGVVERELKQLEEQQMETERKEETKDEQLLGRSGGSGRAADPRGD